MSNLTKYLAQEISELTLDIAKKTNKLETSNNPKTEYTDFLLQIILKFSELTVKYSDLVTELKKEIKK